MKHIKVVALALVSFAYCFADSSAFPQHKQKQQHQQYQQDCPPPEEFDIVEGQPQEAATAVMVKVDLANKMTTIYAIPKAEELLIESATTPEQKAQISKQFETEQNKIGEVAITPENTSSAVDSAAPRWNRSGWNWNRWGGYRSHYNWSTPFYYPGYFNYGNYNYNYGWYYPYNTVHYGWYYR